MKVAVCFSGGVRQFVETYPSFKKHLLDCNIGAEIDVFIHSWNFKTKVWKRGQAPDAGSVDDALSLYKPVFSEIETYDDNMKQKLLKESKIDKFLKYLKSAGFNLKSVAGRKCFISGGIMRDNCIALFYGLNKVNLMRKAYEESHGFKYDLVIRNRFDNIFFSDVDLSKYLEKDGVYVPLGYEPEGGQYTAAQSGTGFINDLFAMGSPDVMDVHMSVYDNYYDYALEAYERQNGLFSGLKLTKFNFIKNKITTYRFYLDFTIYKNLKHYSKAGGVVTGRNWTTLVPKTEAITKE